MVHNPNFESAIQNNFRLLIADLKTFGTFLHTTICANIDLNVKGVEVCNSVCGVVDWHGGFQFKKNVLQ